MVKKMEKQAEKRKEKRTRTEMPVNFHEFGKDPGKGTSGSACMELSPGGLRLRSACFIPMSRRLVMELVLPTLSEPVRILTRVAWVRKTSQGYEVGNQILDISRKDKLAVKELLEAVSRIKDILPALKIFAPAD